MKHNTIEHEIRRRTEAFATELRDLIRRSVLDSIHSTFGAASFSATAAPAVRRSKGPTRSGRAPSSSAGTIIDFVTKNPGSRAEQIAKGLGVTSQRLKKAISTMLASGELKKTGQKRGTQYHPGESPVGAEGAPGGPEKANGRRGKRKVRGGATKRARRA